LYRADLGAKSKIHPVIRLLQGSVRAMPIHVSLEQDQAVYVEPNLWVQRRVG
jgi:hypothetical protein